MSGIEDRDRIRDRDRGGKTLQHDPDPILKILKKNNSYSLTRTQKNHRIPVLFRAENGTGKMFSMTLCVCV